MVLKKWISIRKHFPINPLSSFDYCWGDRKRKRGRGGDRKKRARRTLNTFLGG